MMNHRVTLEECGVLLPLKKRRRMARDERRILVTRPELNWRRARGRHDLWWRLGQWALMDEQEDAKCVMQKPNSRL